MADILKAKNFFQKSLSKQASDVCIKFCLLVLLIVPLYRALVGGALVLVRKRERERERRKFLPGGYSPPLSHYLNSEEIIDFYGVKGRHSLLYPTSLN